MHTDANPEGLTGHGQVGERVPRLGWSIRASRATSRTATPSRRHAREARLDCAFMLVGASHGGCTVGEVESTYTKEFEAWPVR